MTKWFTSDTHFSHRNIINLGAGRPFKDIQEHNEMIIKNWNEKVQPDDIVFHLGDVALGPWPEGLDAVKRLLGYKILVPGNHDRISSVEKEKRRERFLPDYEDAFQEIWDEVSETTVGEHDVLISHYPYTGESHDDRGDRYTHLRPVNTGQILVHGHTHARSVVTRHEGTLQVSVGVDAWDFGPVSEDQVLEVIEREL